MAADGEVDVIRTADGEAVYRSCSTHHHHHVVCRSCGLAVEVTGDAVERWAEAVASEHGFTQVRHTVEIDGLCADCRGRRGDAGRARAQKAETSPTARWGRLSARTTGVWPCRSTATPASRAATA